MLAIIISRAFATTTIFVSEQPEVYLDLNLEPIIYFVCFNTKMVVVTHTHT